MQSVVYMQYGRNGRKNNLVLLRLVFKYIIPHT